MALDPNHFLLANALSEVWEKDEVLSADQKELICKCTGREGAPEGEHELDSLHLAVTSCETLRNIGSGRIHWLSDDGQQFPDMTAQYIHKVAVQLHNYDGELPVEFVEPLVQFVNDTKSHIATLNYDKLLYSSFIDNGVCSGYDGCLVDGMIRNGFSADNLERRYGRDFGYYLHLHGSPLFMSDNNGGIIKLPRDELTLEDEMIGRHIVLTHVKHKPEVILASDA
ncbi:MAG: hypothetical protein KAT90_10100, partial [Gammaproteobacteria bacterium]|nr:hypothetical protein [Gammaproteobacteria bacterium]